MWWKSLFALIAGFLLWRFVGWEDMQTISQIEVPGKVVKVVLVAAITLLVLFIVIVLVVKPWKGTNSGSPRTQTQTPPVTPPPQAETAVPAASGPSMGDKFMGGLWKLLKGIWWLASRLFIVALVTFLVLAYLGDRQSGQAEKIARLEQALEQSEEGAGSTKYVADIDAIPGHSIGNNYDGPLEAEIVKWQRGKVLHFDVHWRRHGLDEVMRVRLSWNGSGYAGYYVQDNPPDHGRIFLKEEGQTESWSGTLEDKSGTVCYYNLKKVR